MAFSSLYYWRVDTYGQYGSALGSQWSFTTEVSAPTSSVPEKPTNPTPADDESDVAFSATLSWGAGIGADDYDVYIGITSALNLDHYQGNFSRGILSFVPSALNYSTEYFWRVDSNNEIGSALGDVWSFTTESAPTLASVNTSAVINILTTAAVGPGYVTDEGGGS